MIDLAQLPPLDFTSRLRRLRARLREAEIDALMVTRLVNVRYLTGFTGSAGMLLVGPEDALFVSDGRYRDQSAEQLAAAGVPVRIEISNSEQRSIVSAAAEGYPRIGLEASGVTWAQQRSFSTDWFPRAVLVPTEGLVEELRRVKDPGEVARVRAACSVADAAFAELLPRMAERPTEAEFALQLETRMRHLGAEAVSFEAIIASGPQGAKPHARPSERRIEAGELVVCDFGAMVDGYCSDMTRTVSVGDPGPEAARLFAVVAESQRAGREAVRAGASCVAVDKACRDVIEEAGLGETFIHGTGHGVGLEIHEAPRVSTMAGEDRLDSGYIVTVEPGVYLSGFGGVRIEDTVVVTPEGCLILTEAPKDLVL
ncbi:MAG: aminopeptidase P family protein [Acidimicrobiia bacterium]